MRMLTIRLPILAICSAITSGCATLDNAECQSADWYLIGFEDGSRGYDASRIRSHRQACAEAQVTPDINRYLLGLERGYQDYCVANKGYQLGATGGSYNNVCPAKQAAEFAQAFQHGRDYHRISSAITELEQRLQDNQLQLDELTANNQKLEQQLISAEGNSSSRQSYLNTIKSNERTILRLEESNLYCERELSVLYNDQQALESLHRQLGYFL